MVVPHSSEKLRSIWNKYLNELIEVEVEESKSLICASAVNELMGTAILYKIYLFYKIFNEYVEI